MMERGGSAHAQARLAAILTPLALREVVALGCTMVDAMLARLGRPWHSNYVGAAETVAALRSWLAGRGSAAACGEAERAIGHSHIDGRVRSARNLARLVNGEDSRPPAEILAEIIDCGCFVANIEVYCNRMNAAADKRAAERGAAEAGCAAGLEAGAALFEQVAALLLETDEAP